MTKPPLSVIEIATHREMREGDRRQWLRLSPQLVAALETLAKQNGETLEALLVDLVRDGLAYRAMMRPFRPAKASDDAEP